MNIGILSLLFSVFCYALMAIPTRYLPGVNSIFLVWTAFLFLAVVSFIVLKLKGAKLSWFKESFKADYKSLILLGVGHALSMLCLNLAVKYLDLSLAGLLLYTAPVWVFIYSIATKELKFSLKNSILFFSSVLAMLIIVNPFEANFAEMSLLGLFYGVSSGVLYSLDFIVGENLAKKHNPFEILFWVHLIGSIILSPALLYLPESSNLVDSAMIFSFDILLLLSFLTFVYGVGKVKAFYASIITLFEPIFLGIIGLILFTEIPSLNILIGGGLLLINVFILSLKESEKELQPAIGLKDRIFNIWRKRL